MRFVTAVRVLAYCCVAVPAGAQSTFANVRAEALPTVYVTDRAGHETKGQLFSITDTEIRLVTGSVTKTFTPADVSLIERKGDSLRNGTLIGLTIGIVGASAMASSCVHHGCGGVVIPYMLAATGVYTAIGAAIDAAIPGRARIWPAKPQTASAP